MDNNQSSLKAVIVCDDSLRAAGLSHVLREHYGIDASVPTDMLCPDADADVYFISPEWLVKLHRFFMPRMRHTVVLTREAVHSPVLTIDTTRPIDDIVVALRPIVSTLKADAAKDSPQLSVRELDVLRLLALGHINKEIATMLNISLNTVLSHRKNIISKLGIKSAQGLTVYALMNGLISHASHPHPHSHTHNDTHQVNDLNQ